MALESPVAKETALSIFPLQRTADLVEEFRLDCFTRNMEPESVRRYLSCFGIFLNFLKERNVFVLKVSKKDLENYIDYRRTHGGKHGDGVSVRTLENDFAAISSFFDFAEYKEYVQKNNTKSVRERYLRKYKEDTVDDSKRKVISIEQMSMLINSVLNTRDRCIMLVFAKTGIRRNELIQMNIDDVNWEELSIRLKNRNHRKHKKRSKDKVFFDDEAGRWMKSWLRIRESLQPNTAAFFLNERGDRLQRNGILSMVKKYAQRVGLDDPQSDMVEDHFSPHNFRHWFSTHLRKAGMDRDFITILRGDARRGTLPIYDEVDDEELRKSYLAHIPQLGV